ncbi:hypothetical protein BJ742DRAFT_45024 [Cladochytrium replicatum]|nr:hypothetical protein BJ742DRAFT_45024 [Cladochytrium replicatum]
MDLRWRMVAELTAGVITGLLKVHTTMTTLQLRSLTFLFYGWNASRWRSTGSFASLTLCLRRIPTYLPRGRRGQITLVRCEPRCAPGGTHEPRRTRDIRFSEPYMLKIRGGKDDVMTRIVRSMCSGLCGAFLSTSADVIKTRWMNQDPKNPI